MNVHNGYFGKSIYIWSHIHSELYLNQNSNMYVYTWNDNKKYFQLYLYSILTYIPWPHTQLYIIKGLLMTKCEILLFL